MASTAEIGKLRAELVLKNKKFEAGMKRAQKSAKKTAGAFKGMGGALVAAFGVAAIGRFVKGTLSMADSVGKFADRIGISTDALQEYRFAFDIAGVEQKKLDKGLLEFGKRIAQARVETGSMVTILGRLDAGLLETLKATTDTNKAFEIMFEALGNATDQATKLALADAAFGGPGLRMTSAFKDSTKAFKETIAEGRRLNLFLEEELVRGAENVNDRFNIASRAIGVNFKRAFLRLAPALSATARFLSENMPAAIQVTSNAFETLITGMAFANSQINKSLNIMLIGIADTLEKLQRIFINVFDADPRKLGFLTEFLKELRAQIQDNIPLITKLDQHLRNLFLIQGKTGLGKFPPGSGLEPEFDLSVGGGKKAKLFPGVPTLDLAPQFGDAPRTDAFLRMKEILESIRDPFKVFNEELALAKKLMDEGKISKSQFLDFKIELSQATGLSNLKTLLQEMNDPLRAFRQHFQELKFLFDEGKISQDQFTESLRNLNLNAALFLSDKNEILGFIRDITVESVDRWAAMFDSMIEGTLTFKDAFLDILKEIRFAIIRTFTQNFAENILTFAADLLFPGAGQAVRVASRAHGGAVGAGKGFLVGERGPELFVPGVAGKIIPNDKMGGNTIYIDARNSQGEAELQRTIRRTIAEATPFLTDVAVRTVSNIHAHDPDFLR